MKHIALAADLGAESGRVIAGKLENGTLNLAETARFANGPVWFDGAYRWNILSLHEGILNGLKKSSAAVPGASSVSVDAWGVDYVWMGLGESMLAAPHQYRDPRSAAPYSRLRHSPGDVTIYDETGIQFMNFNTLYQLAADIEQHGALLEKADRFLFIADWFHALLSGRCAVEPSIASTSQLYNPRTRTWSNKLATAIGLPTRLLPEIVPSGTVLGGLTPAMRNQIGSDLEVIATCSHDTGAAVAAVPAEGDDWAYLSSGTWSLIGLEVAEPLITAEALKANVTNEIGYGHSVRLLKNITGLWIMQECRRSWANSGAEWSYADLNAAAESVPGLTTLIHPDHPPFLTPGDMPDKIAAYCKATLQEVPNSPGAIARCILESLALLYRVNLDRLCALTGRTVRTLHIVGGGSQSVLLNQFAANATQRRVVAGPVEATAIGNVLLQLVARGVLPDLAAVRSIVRTSFPLTEYQPASEAAWEQALARFKTLPIQA